MQITSRIPVSINLKREITTLSFIREVVSLGKREGVKLNFQRSLENANNRRSGGQINFTRTNEKLHTAKEEITASFARELMSLGITPEKRNASATLVLASNNTYKASRNE